MNKGYIYNLCNKTTLYHIMHITLIVILFMWVSAAAFLIYTVYGQNKYHLFGAKNQTPIHPPGESYAYEIQEQNKICWNAGCPDCKSWCEVKISK
jgi:hypothetical protein